MDELPLEVLYNIANNLNFPQISSLCDTSERYRELLCDNDHFWEQKYHQDYSVVPVTQPGAAYERAYYRLIDNRSLVEPALYGYDRVFNKAVRTVRPKVLDYVMPFVVYGHNPLLVEAVLDLYDFSSELNAGKYIIPSIVQLALTAATAPINPAMLDMYHKLAIDDPTLVAEYSIDNIIAADALECYKAKGVPLTWAMYANMFKAQARRLITYVQDKLPTFNLSEIINATDRDSPDYVIYNMAQQITDFSALIDYINEYGTTRGLFKMWPYLAARVPYTVFLRRVADPHHRWALWMMLFPSAHSDKWRRLFTVVIIMNLANMLPTMDSTDVYSLYLASIYYGYRPPGGYLGDSITWSALNINNPEFRQRHWYTMDAAQDVTMAITVKDYYILLRGFVVVNDARTISTCLLRPGQTYIIRLLRSNAMMANTCLSDLVPALYNMLRPYIV